MLLLLDYCVDLNKSVQVCWGNFCHRISCVFLFDMRRRTSFTEIYHSFPRKQNRQSVSPSPKSEALNFSDIKTPEHSAGMQAGLVFTLSVNWHVSCLCLKQKLSELTNNSAVFSSPAAMFRCRPTSKIPPSTTYSKPKGSR